MTDERKLDLFKENKTDYMAPKQPALLNVASAQYISIDGTGHPRGEQFIDAIASLYGVAFTIKMTYKITGRDYAVCKLEAAWSVDGGKAFKDSRPEDIHFTLMIRTPDFIKKSHLAEAQFALAKRGKAPRARDVKLEKMREGKCVQMLHVGPYDQEHLTIDQMSDFASENGLDLCGKAHEIYISDPRRVSPERLKTIIRIPVSRK